MNSVTVGTVRIYACKLMCTYVHACTSKLEFGILFGTMRYTKTDYIARKFGRISKNLLNDCVCRLSRPKCHIIRKILRNTIPDTTKKIKAIGRHYRYTSKKVYQRIP